MAGTIPPAWKVTPWSGLIGLGQVKAVAFTLAVSHWAPVQAGCWLAYGCYFLTLYLLPGTCLICSYHLHIKWHVCFTCSLRIIASCHCTEDRQPSSFSANHQNKSATPPFQKHYPGCWAVVLVNDQSTSSAFLCTHLHHQPPYGDISTTSLPMGMVIVAYNSAYNNMFTSIISL